MLRVRTGLLRPSRRAVSDPATRVLFVCVHNSARSQMAEAFVRRLCAGNAQPESAGLEPTALNSVVVEAMREIGIDISEQKPKSVFELFKAGGRFDYVITVCDETSGGRCPVFPGASKRLHWSFEDPASFAGSWDERLAQTRRVRDAIKTRVEALCAEISSLRKAGTA